MIKKYFIFSVLCISFPTMAQLVDMMGSLGIQGVLVQQEAQSAAQTLSTARRLQMVQGIQSTVMQIRTRYMGNYTQVSTSSVSGNPLSGWDWQVGSVGSHRFFITINQLDKATCNYLSEQQLSAVSREINPTGICGENNQIKLIFD